MSASAGPGSATRSETSEVLNWPGLLADLLAGRTLSASSTGWAMDQIMSGTATSAQIAGFLIALRAKGETAGEVEGMVRVMLDRAEPLSVPPDAVDTCGTGGDQARTVNISTMAAIVVAGAGVPVVKHGNRAASSRSGSADLLEALGVPVDLGPEGVAATVADVGIGFCFAPVFHPSLRHAGPTRRELGVPTVFNILGPLTNPARPIAQAVGCADARLAPVMAHVLADRGTTALVFRGEDGLDELSPTGPSRIWVVTDGHVALERSFDPVDMGVPRAQLEDLQGGDAQENALVAREVLAGKEGPVRDAVVLNAAAGLAAYGAATGSGPSLAGLESAMREGWRRASESLDSGAAAGVLERWVGAGSSL